MKRLLAMALLCLAVCLSARAQNNVAIKTNVLSDAFMNINLGMEVGLAPRWTLDVGGQLNDWVLSHGRRWKHWGVQPEARYWFCDRFAGHFLGFHAFTGQYNIGGIGKNFTFLGTDYGATIHHRYQGIFVGAGVAYGYAYALGKHWNLEAELGIGYAYLTYDKFACTGCGALEGSGHHNYFGLTKAAVSIVYLF
ncbi:MAG: DUF3575 domain-containing protein [Porphyromonadaceae bacterium]|nr:DUF3575 domain-containing protein [Porphyromonadaceae bacterium]